MKPERIAQVGHQHHQVGEQEDQRDGIRHPGHGTEQLRRGQLSDRGEQEEPGRQVVEEQVPGDEPVPARDLGHVLGQIAGLDRSRLVVPLHVTPPWRNSTARITAIVASVLARVRP